MKNFDNHAKTEMDDVQFQLYNKGLNLNQIIKLDIRPNGIMIDTSHLHCPTLDENPIFRTIIGDINKWNKDVLASDKSGKKIDKAGLKNNVYKQLKNQLLEIIIAKNPHAQLQLLTAINKWYQDQKMLCRTQKDMVVFKFQEQQQLELLELQQQAKLIEQIPPLKNEFDTVCRTRHDNIEPAEDRVKTFVRKNLNSYSFLTRPSTSENDKVTSLLGSRPGTKGSDYLKTGPSDARPNTTATDKRAIFSSQSQRQKTAPGHERFVMKQVLGSASSGWNYNDQFAFTNFAYIEPPYVKPVPKDENAPMQHIDVNMIPGIKNYVSDKQTLSAYSEQGITPSNRQLRGAFVTYKSSGGLEEARLEGKWLINRQKALVDKKENEEIIEHIQEWAEAKAIIEQEINKKNEIQAEGSRFQQIGEISAKNIPSTLMEVKNYLQLCESPTQTQKVSAKILDQTQQFDSWKPKTTTGRMQGNYMEKLQTEPQDEKTLKYLENFKDTTLNNNYLTLINREGQEKDNRFAQFEDYEKRTKQEKLEQLKKIKGSIIQWNQENHEQMKNTDQYLLEKRKNDSISIYSKPRNQKIKHRPFTSTFKRFQQEGICMDQQAEVKTLKNILTKTGLKCSLQTLHQALVTPLGFDKNSFSSIKLPYSINSLLEDPKFDVVKKTKKGKKKKE